VNEGAILVGQVAALAPHKDQLTFVRAISALRQRRPQVVGVIVGDGELKTELETEAQRLKLGDGFKILGQRSDPLNCLAAFDVFCLSSTKEGLGTSILDAMALRIPVAATRAGGIPEMIQEGETGFLSEPRNPEALAVAIERALDPSVRARISDAAFAKCRQFDVSHTISGTLSVYNYILQKTNKSL
jgi:glycosyltransferase involved in cell wall biosynthesis